MLIGAVKINGESFYFGAKYNKSETVYYLVSPYHKDDIANALIGAPLSYVVIQDAGALKEYYSIDYLMECLKVSCASSTVKKFGNVNTIELILEALDFARVYKFPDNCISENSSKSSLGKIEQRFCAKDSRCFYAYSKVNGEYVSLSLVYNGITIELSESRWKIPVKGITFTEVKGRQVSRVQVATLKTITYEDLASFSDMSWYRDATGVKKKYKAIKTQQSFELEVITPLVKTILREHSCGRQLDVALDTEATGLHVYNLSKSNPDKSHCVSLQLSWEDNQGVVIFLDMEHFPNVPSSYVCNRIQEIFGVHKEPFEMEIYNYTGSACVKERVVLDRSWYNLLGHNCSFDRRAVYDEGAEVWFDDDTLLMAFNINTKAVRGNNKLKNLTRRFFHHETPELSDILGKGNEDKYKYLADEEVAIIYGCADTDYTRQLKPILKRLLGDYLYQRYRMQDMRLLNVLAISEYYGLNTIADKVEVLADEVWHNLEILKDLMYRYVGAYVDYTQYAKILEIAVQSGSITQEEYERRMLEYTPDPSLKYVFEFKGADLRQILYDVMKYPIKKYSPNGLPAVDKFAVKKLLQVKRSADSNARKLKEDVLVYGADYAEYKRLCGGTEVDKKKAEGMVLVSAAEFNSLQYPLALILQKYSALNKEYTSYFKPIKEKNLENKMFYSYNMARIETRRIANPGQTMKGKLKALIRSYSDDFYVLDFDMSQAEYRVMISLAGYLALIARMKNPENDYHTETAAAVNSIPPHKVSKKVRKQTKPISFGIPYGLGERSLCETIFNEVNEHNLFATRMLMAKWQENNAPVMSLLEEARKEALVEWKIDDELRDYMDAWVKEVDSEGKVVKDCLGRPVYKLDEFGKKIPVPISRVTNEYGFYRTFDLSNIDMSPSAVARRESGVFNGPEGVIRRAAGNYGIQSFAAELFRIILTRFYENCEACGIHHGEKIIWHMLIHDELLASVHKSIHPFQIYKLVKQSCMLTMEGHTNYFVGINIGDTWGECKDDAREAPVFFVDRMVKRWDKGEFSLENTPEEFKRDGGYWFDHPFDFIKPYMDQYRCDRIGEVVKSIQPDVDSAPLDVKKLIAGFSNYTVRAYVDDYKPRAKVNQEDFFLGIAPDGKRIYDEDSLSDAKWQSKLETWCLLYFGEGKEIIDVSGKHRVVVTDTSAFVEESEEFAEEFEESSVEMEERIFGDYFDFDENDVFNVYNEELYDLSEYSQEEEVSLRETKYECIRKYGNQIIITVKNELVKSAVKDYLSLYRSASGCPVLFKVRGDVERWIKVRDSVSLTDLDKFVSEQNEKVSNCKGNTRITGSGVIIKAKNPLEQKRIVSNLKDCAGDDISVKVVDAFNDVVGIYSVRKDCDLSMISAS